MNAKSVRITLVRNPDESSGYKFAEPSENTEYIKCKWNGYVFETSKGLSSYQGKVLAVLGINVFSKTSIKIHTEFKDEYELYNEKAKAAKDEAKAKAEAMAKAKANAEAKAKAEANAAKAIAEANAQAKAKANAAKANAELRNRFKGLETLFLDFEDKQELITDKFTVQKYVNMNGTCKLSFIDKNTGTYSFYINGIQKSNLYNIDFNRMTVNDIKNLEWTIAKGDGWRGGKVAHKRTYMSRTVKELQTLAKSRGIPYSGLNKNDLVLRLQGKRR